MKANTDEPEQPTEPVIQKITIRKKKPAKDNGANAIATENITSEIIEKPKTTRTRAKKQEKELDFSDTCIVCAEKSNKSNHLPIKCQYCDFTACRECCETYILNDEEPHCMDNKCKKVWTRQYLAQVFSKVFCSTTLKAHRENVLLEKNKAMLPTVIPLIEVLNLRKKLNEEDRELFEKENKVRKEREAVQLRIARISNAVNRFYNSNATVFTLENNNSNEKKEEAERNVFIRPCPADECRGFLSSKWKCGICEIWVCPDCGEIKGKDHNAEHTCKQENKESMELMKKDTRPCPECGTRIFKIEGCDQMFCTKCNTGFNWKTGKVMRGEMHNPHYFEWLRRTGGAQPGQVADPCPGVNNHNRIERAILTRMDYLEEIIYTKYAIINKYHLNPISKGEPSRLQVELKYYYKTYGHNNLNVQYLIRNRQQNNSIDEYKKFWIKNDKERIHQIVNNIIRNTGHTRFEMQGRYHVDDNSTREIKELQVAFLTNKIDEQWFKTRIHQITKREEKNREIMDVVNLLCDTVMSIIVRFCATIMKNIDTINLHQLLEGSDQYVPGKLQELIDMSNKSIGDFMDGSILKEIIGIVDYANECFKLISGAYQCVVIKYDYSMNRVIQRSGKQNTENNGNIGNNRNNINDDVLMRQNPYRNNRQYVNPTAVVSDPTFDTEKYNPNSPEYFDWLITK